MSDNERFIEFKDMMDIEHTYRIVDIQAIGISTNDRSPSYIRAHNFALTVPRNEAMRVRTIWLKEG